MELLLTETEENIVADLYKVPDVDPPMVEYRRFCVDMETCNVRHHMELDIRSKIDAKVDLK